MRPADATLAEPLPEDEIHLWQLVYERGQGRQPLLRLLGRYLGCAPGQVALIHNPHGRPELAGPPSLRFNWSHCGERAVVALARNVQPGIDLERLRPRPRALALAQRFFAPAEAAALAALPNDELARAFLSRWTAKEAVLKALGRGIAFGLHRLSIAQDPGGVRLEALEGEDPRAWQLQSIELDGDYLAALAWRGGAHKLRLRKLAQAADCPTTASETDLAR